MMRILGYSNISIVHSYRQSATPKLGQRKAVALAAAGGDFGGEVEPME